MRLLYELLLLFLFLFNNSVSLLNHVYPKSTLQSLAAQNLLIYEYSNSFKLNKTQKLQEYLYENKEWDNMDKISKHSLNYLSRISPLGKVELFENNEISDLQAGVTKSDLNKRICVVFRGSQSNIDWKYNIMTRKKYFNYIDYPKNEGKIGIHSGFYEHLHMGESYKNIDNTVFKLIKKYPNYEIYITGHSLGGALCTLYGYELSQKVNKKINVISFASPRLGNKWFKKKVENIDNLNILRITYKKDIVTCFPMFNYYHVGDNLYFSDNDYTFYNKDNPYSRFKYSIFNCYSISDHDMKNYYYKIRKLL
tara:strand:- start:554 stop:1480 length:927 start_codon:yes stop_codon:yes gene_type:complete